MGNLFCTYRLRGFCAKQDCRRTTQKSRYVIAYFWRGRTPKERLRHTKEEGTTRVPNRHWRLPHAVGTRYAACERHCCSLVASSHLLLKSVQYLAAVINMLPVSTTVAASVSRTRNYMSLCTIMSKNVPPAPSLKPNIIHQALVIHPLCIMKSNMRLALFTSICSNGLAQQLQTYEQQINLLGIPL